MNGVVILWLLSLLYVPYISQNSVEWNLVNDCGPASAHMVVQYVTDEVYHPYTFYEEMNSQKHKVTSGFDLAEWMTLKGVSAKYEYGWTIEQLRITVESGKPVIAYLEQSFGGHFVVVIGVMDDVVYIHDPGVGPVVGILIEEFEYMWSYPASWQHNRVIAYEEGGE